MTLRYLSIVFLLVLVNVFPANASLMQIEMTIDDLKAGVVRITSTLDGKTRIGTGIIVNLEEDMAYIVTASHVIEGDQQPQVTFFPDPNETFTAKVIGLEGGDPKGLAALRVKGAPSSGLRMLGIDKNIMVQGGEHVTLIGFPRILGTPWAITGGIVAGQRGSDLTFSGAVDEGNSGGPLLIDGKVVGVVTQASGQFGYASPTVTMQYTLSGWGVGVKTSTSEVSVKSASTEMAKVDSTSEEVERLKRELEEANQAGQARAAEAARAQSEFGHS